MVKIKVRNRNGRIRAGKGARWAIRGKGKYSGKRETGGFGVKDNGLKLQKREDEN